MLLLKRGLSLATWLYALPLAVTLATPSYSQQQPPPLAFRLDAVRDLYYNGGQAFHDVFVSPCNERSYNNTQLYDSFETGKMAGPNTASAYTQAHTVGNSANATQNGAGTLTVYALGPTGTPVHLDWILTGQASVSGQGGSASASGGGASASLTGRTSDTSNKNYVFDGVTAAEVSCGGTTYSYVTQIDIGNFVGTGGNCNGCTADAMVTVNVSGYLIRPNQQPPVAIIAPPTPSNPLPGTPVTLDGTGSYSPTGTPLIDHKWTIEDPAAPNGTATQSGLTIQYTWQQGGTYNVTLTVTDSDGLTGTANSSVNVQSQGAQIQVTPPNIDFGSVPPSKTGTKRLTIQNVGPPGSTLNGNLFSPGDPFSIVNGATAFSLASGASTTVDIEFAPSAKGTFNDVITITSNDPNSPAVVPLKGVADDLQTVTVWISSFIPYSQFGALSSLPGGVLVTLPQGFPYSLAQIDVHGDGRSFSNDPNASFRVQWLEQFDAATLTPILYSPTVSTSQLVDHNTGAVLASATPSAANMQLDSPTQVGSLVYVHAYGGARFGFLDFPYAAPPVHADMTFRIDLTNRTCQLVGTYGAFPAFEAYIQANNDTPVPLLQHDVGPELLWPVWILGLYRQNYNTVTGTTVPF